MLLIKKYKKERKVESGRGVRREKRNEPILLFFVEREKE